jgi:pimeloyl-ACP methyl ester carboxylesterase
MTTPRLHERSWGSGPRRALLLHGSTSSSATWWRVGPALAERGWFMRALDLPSHGDSPALGAPLVPAAAASAVAATTAGQGFDLVLGHSFGAAVALALVAEQPDVAPQLVLEELPGASSVDWNAEAGAVRDGARAARLDAAAAVARTRADQRRWAEQDCHHAAADLARCHADDVAAGLRYGRTWTHPDQLTAGAAAVMLLLAPDATGVNRLDDATALRGQDRRRFAVGLDAHLAVLDTGHRLHRDDPEGWLDAVSTFAARELHS